MPSASHQGVAERCIVGVSVQALSQIYISNQISVKKNSFTGAELRDIQNDNEGKL